MRKLGTSVLTGLSALAFAGMTAAPAAAANANVTIAKTGCSPQQYCYKPSALSVADGTTVVWTDTSGAHHDVTRCTTAECAGTGPGTGTDATFTSGNVAPNGTFSHAFHGTGTYNYFCTIHGYAVMHGTVTVNAPK